MSGTNSQESNQKGWRSIPSYAHIPFDTADVWVSPSELLISRKLRTNIPATRESLKPSVPDPSIVREREKQLREQTRRDYDRHNGVRELEPLSPFGSQTEMKKLKFAMKQVPDHTKFRHRTGEYTAVTDEHLLKCQTLIRSTEIRHPKRSKPISMRRKQL